MEARTYGNRCLHDSEMPQEPSPHGQYPAERARPQVLLELYRHGDDPRARLRCHILLLLDDEFPWSTIAGVLFTSPPTIARTKRAFLSRGIDAAFACPGGRPPLLGFLATLVLSWALSLRPGLLETARDGVRRRAGLTVTPGPDGTVVRGAPRMDTVKDRPPMSVPASLHKGYGLGDVQTSAVLEHAREYGRHWVIDAPWCNGRGHEDEPPVPCYRPSQEPGAEPLPGG